VASAETRAAEIAIAAVCSSENRRRCAGASAASAPAGLLRGSSAFRRARHSACAPPSSVTSFITVFSVGRARPEKATEMTLFEIPVRALSAASVGLPADLFRSLSASANASTESGSGS
jgi:hypothetical protein